MMCPEPKPCWIPGLRLRGVFWISEKGYRDAIQVSFVVPLCRAAPFPSRGFVPVRRYRGWSHDCLRIGDGWTVGNNWKIVTTLIIYHSTVTIIVFLYHDTTVKLLLLLTLLIKLYPSLRILLRYLGVLTSLVSAMARKFMQGRHPNWYRSWLVPHYSISTG